MSGVVKVGGGECRILHWGWWMSGVVNVGGGESRGGECRTIILNIWFSGKIDCSPVLSIQSPPNKCAADRWVGDTGWPVDWNKDISVVLLCLLSTALDWGWCPSSIYIYKLFSVDPTKSTIKDKPRWYHQQHQPKKVSWWRSGQTEWRLEPTIPAISFNVVQIWSTSTIWSALIY